ncbi:MAG: SAM-dependent methyltransferase [Treponema sp.]|nr:SAM-dependent methyltransferase [Treponema sp.]
MASAISSNGEIFIYKEVIDAILRTAHQELIKIVFSLPGKGAQKSVIKPVLLKKNKAWQCEKIIDNSAFHENISESGLRVFLERLIDENQYRQIYIITVNHVAAYRISRKNKLSMTKTANVAASVSSRPSLNHDNEKNYLLKEGMNILPLVDLGVFTEDFHIIKTKYYKFKQINSFLKNIISGMGDDINDTLNIVEFGCGKSYLTFILFYYFRFIKNINVKITGYDKDKYAVDFCNNVASKYKYNNLEFLEGDVSRIAPHHENADMIITLHACDTATDHALHYAVKNNVKHVFCVPCCQQEVNSQLKHCVNTNHTDIYPFFLRYGLFKERFSALLTDCIRCEILSDSGYYVDVVEFIGEENTPKNAMIRARYTGHKKNYREDIRKLMTQLGIEHTLLKLIGKDGE